MARYKIVDMSPRLLPVDLEAQLIPGSFAHAVHHVVDALDLSAFDAHYRNDEVGASAHAPTMLLKAVLLAYSQGMVSSRAIERACRDNVLFIALTGDAKPHFTTIADFVSRSRDGKRPPTTPSILIDSLLRSRSFCNGGVQRCRTNCLRG